VSVDVQVIKTFSMRVEPLESRYWLVLELEDGSKPDGMAFSTVGDLAAMMDILRHAPRAVYYTHERAIEASGVPVGKSSGPYKE